MKKIEYPYQICFECGDAYGNHTGCASTMHEGKCQVCGKIAIVTEPRDFGYPDFPNKEFYSCK